MLDQLIGWCLTLPPLVYVVVGLATVWYFAARSRYPDNIPPFPVKPYPVVGHLHLTGRNPIPAFHKWRQTVGDIFSVKMGQKLAVVFNSHDLIKEAFVKKADYFSDRPMTLLTKNQLKHGEALGILRNSGADWKEQRTLSVGILRDFGMGKNWLAEKITQEVELYLEVLAEFKGQPSDIRILTNTTVSNVICAILVGHRFELDDPKFIHLVKLLNESISGSGAIWLLNFMPWLTLLPGDLFGLKKMEANMQDVKEHFSVKFFGEAKENIDEQDNFIKAYLDEMTLRQKGDGKTYLSEKALLRIMTDLFAAGTETTSTTIMWALLFALRHPEAQEKFYKEIVDVVGSSRRPTIQDKTQMHYVNAYIMETQRLGSIVPLTLGHTCNATVEVGGYTIPKDTYTIPNFDEVLKDPKTWNEPLEFKPERFLDKDNKIFIPEQFIPFSIGRRYCMGESLAKMELFLFLTAIFQRFHLQPEDPNNLPTTERIFGITSAPKSYKIKLIERNE